MNNLVPIALFLCITFMVLGLARILSDGFTRRKLIQAGATSELAAAVAEASRNHSSADDSLKWGLVIGAVGLGLIAVQFLPYAHDDPISLGLVLVFGAAGLLGHHALARRAAGGHDREARRIAT